MVEVRNLTNPNIKQVRFMARIEEWERLIEYLEDAEDDETLTAFSECLHQVINEHQKEYTVKT